MEKFIPPHGTNLRSNSELPPTLLSEALTQTVSFLQSVEPLETRVYKYADWWEHSGLHFAECSLKFADLLQIVCSPTALLKAMPGDFCVFTGIAPQDFRWYLRFYLDPDAEDAERFGRFDLTVPAELVQQYKEKVAGPLGLEMQEQDASQYYQSIQQGQ